MAVLCLLALGRLHRRLPGFFHPGVELRMLEGKVLFEFRGEAELQLAIRTLKDIHGNSLGNAGPLSLNSHPPKGSRT